MKRWWKSFRRMFVMRAEISKTADYGFFMLAVVTILVAYHLTAYSDTNKLFPRWDQLWEGVKKIITDPVTGDHFLWEDTLASFGRILPAIGLSAVIGVTLGMYMGLYAPVKSFTERILTFFGGIPANAVMVIFMAYLGFELKMFVGVIAFGIMMMITKAVYFAVKAIHNEEIYSLKMLGCSNTEIIWSILFYQILPQILAAVQATFSPAFIFVISAEWISANVGFGYRFMMFKRTARMELIIPYVFYLGLLNVLILGIFSILERVLCPWYVKEDNS